MRPTKSLLAIAIGAMTLVALRKEIFPLVEVNYVHGPDVRDPTPSPVTGSMNTDIAVLSVAGLILVATLSFCLVEIFKVPVPWFAIDVATNAGALWSSGGSIPSR